VHGGAATVSIPQPPQNQPTIPKLAGGAVKQTAVLIATSAQLYLAEASPYRKWREKRSQIHPHGSTVMPMKSA
jgi:hypothetical protein